MKIFKTYDTDEMGTYTGLSDGYLVGKELVILLFECVVGKNILLCDVFSFPPGVYVGSLNLIASISCTSILALDARIPLTRSTRLDYLCTEH